MSNYFKKTKRASEEIQYDKIYSEQNKVAAEKGYDMSNSEYYARLSWDRTCQERDDLKNQVKALSAIKKGLETSLSQAFDKIKEYEQKLNEKN